MTEIVKELSHLLGDRSAIAEGGAPFRQWVADTGAFALKGIDYDSIMSVAIPQFGEEAGTDKQVVAKKKGIYAATTTEQSLRLWGTCRNENAALRIGTDPAARPIILVFCPIAHAFDRPIGYYAVACCEKDATAIAQRLDIAAWVVAAIVHHQKLRRAMQLLAHPGWRGVSDIKVAAGEATSACLQALSCNATVAWTLDDPLRPTQLLTLATAGDATGLNIDMGYGRGIAGKCVAENRMRIVDDFANETAIQSFQPTGIEHPDIVRTSGWHSGIFVPLDAGGRIAGLIAAYGNRINAFSTSEQEIVLAFAQRLSMSFVHLDRVRELETLQRRFARSAPVIATGKSAIDTVHDANQLLMKIQDKLTKIRTDVQGKDEVTFERTIAASTQVQSASELLGEIMDNTRLDRLRVRRYDLKDLVNEVFGIFEERCASKHIELRNECPECTLVYIDRVKVKRVLSNLIDNAMYFLSRSGKGDRYIAVRTAHAEAGQIGVTVFDNGLGISEDDLPHVFEYMFSNKGDEGTGFGLSIAKEIIRRHNGEIRAESHWGQWTKFTFTLPTESFNPRME